jgi:hypothetical protein
LFIFILVRQTPYSQTLAVSRIDMNDELINIYSYNLGDNPVRTIGINQEGQFFVDSKSRLTILDKRENYVALLTILETDKNKFESELREKVGQEKINKLKKELFKCGLTVSPYWSELVADWIETDDIDKEMKELLTVTIQDKRVNQGQRNKIRRLIKNFQYRPNRQQEL